MDDQPTIGGKQARGRPSADEGASTQISGSSEPSSKTIPGPEAGAWPPISRSSYRAVPEVPPPPGAPSSGTETVIMEIEPQGGIPLAWLVVLEGPGAKRGKMVLLQGETIVGRSQGDLVLSGDHSVSGQHIKVRLEEKEGDPEGRQVFVLYDLASKNGTFAGTRENYQNDGSRVYRAELQDGMFILVGKTTFVFKAVI